MAKIKEKMLQINQSQVHRVSAVCLLISIGIIFYLNAQIIMYADDFFYATFFRGGFGVFMDNTIMHYNYFNGRVLVHVLAQITLLFGVRLVPFINLVFLLSICFFTYRLHYNHTDKRDFYVFSTFFFCTFMLIDVMILRSSFLWTSATFNYTLGIVGVCAMLFLAKEFMHKDKIPWYVIPISFAAGATTEQNGLTALFGVTLFFFTGFVLNGREQVKRVKNFLFFIIPCFAGFVSIFMSPATRSRMENEISDIWSGILPTLLDRLARFSDIINIRHHVVLFVLFGIFLGLLLFHGAKFSKGLCLIVIFSPVLLILLRLPLFEEMLYAVAILIYLSLAALIAIKSKEYAFVGIIVLTSLFSYAVIFATDTIVPRVIFPLNLLFISALALLALRIIKVYKNASFALPFYLAMCFVVLIPTIIGYRENRMLMEMNLANLQGTGDIFFNVDFNDRYRHALPQDHPFAFNAFRNYHNIGPDRTIYFVSDIFPPLYLDGERLTTPVYYINGEPGKPLRMLINRFGGNFRLANANMVIYFNGIEHNLDNSRSVLGFVRDGRHYEYPVILVNGWLSLVHMNSSSLKELFGISYVFQNGVYIIYGGRYE